MEVEEGIFHTTCSVHLLIITIITVIENVYHNLVIHNC